jgi:hypothetical protein
MIWGLPIDPGAAPAGCATVAALAKPDVVEDAALKAKIALPETSGETAGKKR